MTQKEIKERLDKIEDFSVLDSEINKLLDGGIDSKVLSKYINKVNKEKKQYEDMLQRKELELNYLDNYDIVFGIDEVGRGPLCGPVCAACTMMKKDSKNVFINDSKKLTEEKREELYNIITSDAITYGIALVDAKTIDERSILDATFVAMKNAYDIAKSKIDTKDKKILVIVDGNKKVPYIEDADQITVVKGDSKVYSIAASSIIAKVTRDKIMNELDSKYPEYGFIDNKGYGTKKHIEALKKYGKIEGFHRETFIKNFI